MKFTIGPVVLSASLTVESGWFADVLRDVRPVLRWLAVAGPVSVAVGAALGLA